MVARSYLPVLFKFARRSLGVSAKYISFDGAKFGTIFDICKRLFRRSSRTQGAYRAYTYLQRIDFCKIVKKISQLVNKKIHK